MRERVDYIDREALDLWIAIAIPIGLAMYHFLVQLVGAYSLFIDTLTARPFSTFLNNLLYLWILASLWMAYRQWKEAPSLERQFARVLEGIGGELLLVTGQGNEIMGCNRAISTMFGYDVSEVLHRSPDFLYAESRQKGIPEALLPLHHEDFGIDIRRVCGRRKDGSEFPVEIIDANVLGDAGRVVLFRDVSETASLESRVSQLQVELEEAKTASAKETEQLAQEQENTRRLQHHVMREVEAIAAGLEMDKLETVSAYARSVELMVQALRCVTCDKVEASSLNKVTTNLAELAKAALREVGVRATHHKITIREDEDASDTEVDVPLMRSVFQHLLFNAIDQAPRGTEIDAYMHKVDNWIAVDITDKGPNIPTQYWARIFDKMAAVELHEQGFSTQMTTSLAFCKQAVAAHGGEIWMKSAGDSRTISFSLPISPSSD